MRELILYGRGLIAEEYCRYLEGLGRGREVVAFAVTRLENQGENYCGRPCMEIGEALLKYPEADICLTLQEKYHKEVLALLKTLNKIPKAVIGLHRMTEILGEQGIKEIQAACPDLLVRRNPHDYSMLEIAHKNRPKETFTFYPMTQVPLSEQDLAHIREYMQGDCLYIAMATSQKDAVVCLENLPEFVHLVVGGAANYRGKRSHDKTYDDEMSDNISCYNNVYSELTVAYYLWKKAPRAKYLGLCHYRRHFVLTEEMKESMALGTVDVLLSTPRFTFPNAHKYFTVLPVTTMDELDYECMLRLVERENPELGNFAKDFLEEQIHYPNNMVIAKRDIYLSYCAFMFKVLQGMQSYYEQEGIVRPDRYLGYVGELLTTVYFSYHRDKWNTRFIEYQMLKEKA